MMTLMILHTIKEDGNQDNVQAKGKPSTISLHTLWAEQLVMQNYDDTHVHTNIGLLHSMWIHTENETFGIVEMEWKTGCKFLAIAYFPLQVHHVNIAIFSPSTHPQQKQTFSNNAIHWIISFFFVIITTLTATHGFQLLHKCHTTSENSRWWEPTMTLLTQTSTHMLPWLFFVTKGTTFIRGFFFSGKKLTHNTIGKQSIAYKLDCITCTSDM